MKDRLFQKTDTDAIKNNIFSFLLLRVDISIYFMSHPKNLFFLKTKNDLLQRNTKKKKERHYEKRPNWTDEHTNKKYTKQTNK